MASNRLKVRMVSEEGTGHFYTTDRAKNAEKKLRLKKYDPRLRRHVWYKEGKIK